MIDVRLSTTLLIGGLAIVLSLAVAPMPADAARTDQVFTVAKYPVGATDKNAVAAKEKALADGQKAAFRSLLKRIVPVTAYKQISRLAEIRASDYISGVSVRSERNSSTEYIASLDFSFQPDAVRNILQREGVPFVDAQAQDVRLIPVIREGNPGEYKTDSGLWKTAWSGLDLDHTVTPIELADLKPTIHPDTINMLLNGDDNGLRILAGEYQTDRVLLAIFEPDPAAKKVVVTLAGQDAVGPVLLKRTYSLSDGDLAYASELAAIVALGVIEGRWKVLKYDFSGVATTAGYGGAAQPVWAANRSAVSGEPVSLVVEFNSSNQWNEMRAQLLDTPGVDNVSITALTAYNANVALSYPGGVNALANALGGRGVSLVNIGGSWVLRPAY
jgi:hypothetical protein